MTAFGSPKAKGRLWGESTNFKRLIKREETMYSVRIEDWILDSYVQNSVNAMSEFITENVYPQFPKPTYEIVYDGIEKPGNVGGFIVRNNRQVPYIRLCKWTLRAYVKYGFWEYLHISDDPEIGSIDKIRHWKECVAAVLAHEMAHVLEMAYEEFRVPELYHSYSTESIKYPDQRKYHGTNWQFFYRILRNKFVNGRNSWD